MTRGLTGELHKTFKRESVPIIKSLQKLKRKKFYQTHFTRPELT